MDSVEGVRSIVEDRTIAAEMLLPSLDHLCGVTRVSDEIILIYDLDRFLSLEEETALDSALAGEVK